MKSNRPNMTGFNEFKSYIIRFFSTKHHRKTTKKSKQKLPPFPPFLPSPIIGINAPIHRFKFPKITNVAKPNPDDDNDTSDDTGRPFRLGSYNGWDHDSNAYNPMYDSYLELYVDPKQKKLGKSRSGSNSNNTPNTIPPIDLPKALPALSDDIDWAQYDKLIRKQKKQYESKKKPFDPTDPIVIEDEKPKKTRKPRGKPKPDADSDSEDNDGFQRPWRQKPFDIDPTEAEIVPKKTRKPRGKPKSGSDSKSDPDEHDFGSDDFRQVRQDRQDKSGDSKGGSTRKSKTKK